MLVYQAGYLSLRFPPLLSTFLIHLWITSRFTQRASPSRPVFAGGFENPSSIYPHGYVLWSKHGFKKKGLWSSIPQWESKHNLVGGFNPLKNMKVRLDHHPNDIGEVIKFHGSKPPPTSNH